MTTIDLGGLTFHGMPHPSGLHFRRLRDWEGLPQAKERPVPRPQGHGSFELGSDFREGAVVSVEGWYQGPDRAAAVEMRRRLPGALAGRKLRMTVTDELGPTFRDVRVERAPLGDLIGARFEFAVDVYAPDPFRYGVELAPSTGLPTAGTGAPWPQVWPQNWGTGGDPGRVAMVNEGTAPTRPKLEVRGGLAGGVELVEIITGSYLRLEREIPGDATVVFDTRIERVYLDVPANDVSTDLVRRDWSGFAVPGEGGIRNVQFNGLGAASGSPLLTARFSPAYF